MPDILSVQQLSKNFGGVRAVTDLSFTLQRGEILGLIGPNGAGKTTAFNLINGYVRADGGRVHFEGRDITRLRPDRIAALGIARTFQDLRVFGRLTTLENVMLAIPGQRGEGALRALLPPRMRHREDATVLAQAERWIELFGLAGKEQSLARELSYGQQKLLCLARCMATNPRVLLLDEPISGISPVLIDTIISTLRKLVEQGLSVVIIEHNLRAVADISDRIVNMESGHAVPDATPHLEFGDRILKHARAGAQAWQFSK